VLALGRVVEAKQDAWNRNERHKACRIAIPILAKMSLEEFVQKAVSENKEYVEEIRRLQEILNSLNERQRQRRVYSISVTNNM